LKHPITCNPTPFSPMNNPILGDNLVLWEKTAS
jgi:hypothetical protein